MSTPAYDIVKLARANKRPTGMDYIQNLCADTIIPHICREAQLQVGFYRIQSLLLKLPEQRINPVMIGLVALQALHQLIPVLRPLIQVGQDHQLQHRHPLLYM